MFANAFTLSILYRQCKGIFVLPMEFRTVFWELGDNSSRGTKISSISFSSATLIPLQCSR